MYKYSRVLNDCIFISLLISLVFSGICITSAVHAKDAEGSKDHPLVSRYEGSVIYSYSFSKFNEYGLFIKPVTTRPAEADTYMLLEGKVTNLLYINPAERSILEVFRNYETALKEAGFEILFSCKNKECGKLSFKRARNGYMWASSTSVRYLAAKLPRDEGDVYISLVVSWSESGGGADHERVVTELDVIEIEAMQENMVTVDANAMAKGIGEEGKIALYGILFDVDKAVIKPESKPTLEQISTLLNSNPEMNLVIVGHTDNEGKLDYNMDLSTRRAKAVEAALVTDFGITKDRLSAWGVGYLSPVASNASEQGRALNRRVELVQR